MPSVTNVIASLKIKDNKAPEELFHEIQCEEVNGKLNKLASTNAATFGCQFEKNLKNALHENEDIKLPEIKAATKIFKTMFEENKNEIIITKISMAKPVGDTNLTGRLDMIAKLKGISCDAVIDVKYQKEKKLKLEWAYQIAMYIALMRHRSEEIPINGYIMHLANNTNMVTLYYVNVHLLLKITPSVYPLHWEEMMPKQYFVVSFQFSNQSRHSFMVKNNVTVCVAPVISAGKACTGKILEQIFERKELSCFLSKITENSVSLNSECLIVILKEKEKNIFGPFDNLVCVEWFKVF